MDATNVDQAFEIILKERYKLVHAKQLENNSQPNVPASGARINIAPQEKEKEKKNACC